MNNILGTKLNDSSTTGSLEVITDPPNAQILIDSEPVGYSNTLFAKIWPGKYSLSINKSNYEFYKRDIIISSGPTQILKINLKRLSGKLKVDSYPGNSEVFINGRLFGLTPLLKDLPTDNYKLRLESTGYYPIETEVTIDANHLTSQDIDLKPKPVKVTILTNPADAEVYIVDKANDKKEFLGKTPIYSKNILPGKYKLFYKLDGYDVENLEVKVEPAQNVTIGRVNLSHTRENEIEEESPGKGKQGVDPPYYIVEHFSFSRTDGVLYFASGISFAGLSLFYAVRAQAIHDYNNPSETNGTAEDNKTAAESATALANISLVAAIGTLAVAIPISIFYSLRKNQIISSFKLDLDPINNRYLVSYAF